MPLYGYATVTVGLAGTAGALLDNRVPHLGPEPFWCGSLRHLKLLPSSLPIVVDLLGQFTHEDANISTEGVSKLPVFVRVESQLTPARVQVKWPINEDIVTRWFPRRRCDPESWN